MIGLMDCSSVRREDVALALTPLKTISLEKLNRAGFIDFSLVISDKPEWKRITHEWGDPGYVIAVLGEGRKLKCFDELGIAVEVKAGAELLPIQHSSTPLYGYSQECSSSGVSFKAARGQHLDIHIGRPDKVHVPGVVIVAANWGPEIKDRIVGVDLGEQLGGR
jgi:hypothetical protein